MTGSFSSAAALLLATGCAQEVTVHIRGGDRPPDPDFLHVARPSAQAVQPGSLVVTGGSEVQRFRIGLNHNNLDVNISPNTWFATDGGFLDPAAADPAVRAKIEENVAASIDVYEDDDMDGNPDPLG